jgi:transposase InsO family protein
MIQVVSDYVIYYNEERLQEQLKELTPIQYRAVSSLNVTLLFICHF